MRRGGAQLLGHELMRWPLLRIYTQPVLLGSDQTNAPHIARDSTCAWEGPPVHREGIAPVTCPHNGMSWVFKKREAGPAYDKEPHKL